MTNKLTLKMTEIGFNIVIYILVLLLAYLVVILVWFTPTHKGESNVDDSSLYVYIEPCSNLEK